MVLRRLSFLFLFVISGTIVSLAQPDQGSRVERDVRPYVDEILLRHYSIEQGLEGSYIYSIDQDSLNRLWLGTNLGIMIFDNNRFSFPRVKEMRAEAVTAVVFNDNLLYFCYFNGPVFSFDGDKVTRIPFEGSAPESISRLMVTKEKKIYACTSSGLFVLEPGTSQFKEEKFKGLDGLKIRDIAQSKKDGSLAIATDAGAMLVKNGRVTNLSQTGLPSSNISVVKFDRNNYLWIGTILEGLYVKIGDVYRKFRTADGLPHPTIISIEEDEHGNVLAGTFFGFSLLRSPLYKPTPYFPGRGINGSSIWTIKRDRQNNIWIGTENGLFTYAPSSFTPVSDVNGIINHFVLSAFRDRKNDLWFGTQYGISKFDGDTFFNYQIVHEGKHYKYYAIAQTEDGTMWFGSTGLFSFSGRSYTHYGKDEGFTDSRVTSLVAFEGGLAAGTEEDGLIFYKNGRFSREEMLKGKPITALWKDIFGRLLIGTHEGMYVKTHKQLHKIPGTDKYTILSLFSGSDGKIFAGTERGVYVINQVTLTIADFLPSGENERIHGFEEDGQFIWVGTSRRLWKIKPASLEVEYIGLKHGYKGGGVGTHAVVKDRKGNIFWGSLRHLTKYNAGLYYKKASPPSTFIEQVMLFNQTVNWAESNPDSLQWEDISYSGTMPWLDIPKDLVLPHNVNHITIRFNGVSMLQGNNPEFRYMLEGFDDDWKDSQDSREITYLNLPPGEFTFKVEGKLPGREWESSATYSFEIVPAFWQTKIFTGGITLFALIGLVLGVRWRTNSLQQKKTMLEKIVRVRTKELIVQKHQIEKKNQLLETKTEEIFKSIRYAKRIQEAIIPPEKVFVASFPDAFVFYQPKDIVSGDFYWLEKVDTNHVLFAVADCTGHGVPGAFMSIVGHNGLNKAIGDGKLFQPDVILNNLNDTITHTLRQSVVEGQVRDGMDISLCSLKNFHNFDNSGTQPELQFAGANSPMWLIRNKKDPAPIDSTDYLKVRGEYKDMVLYEIRANKQPIGGAEYLEHEPFKNHAFRLYPGDSVFLFSDGIADQFGGSSDKKFKRRNLGQLLLENQHLNMRDLKDVIQKRWESWKGESEQVDDICMVGVRI